MLINPPVVPSIASAAQNAEVLKGRQLQNKLAEQELSMNPKKIELQEAAMQIRQMALEVQQKALESRGKPVSLDYGDYTISAQDGEVLAVAAQQIAKFPNESADPQTWNTQVMPWLAKQGVTFEKKDVERQIKLLTAKTALANALKKGDEDVVKQSDITKFELFQYGRLSPELRGKPQYQRDYLQFQRLNKEQSPYVDALNRQIEITAKREGSALRKEFYDSPEVKTYQEVSRQHSVMQEAMKEAKTGENFVAVDQALITILNKMMDPSSVVRESEYARTPGDLALMNRIKGAYQKIKTGGAGLTMEDREAIKKMGGKYLSATETKYKSKLHEYKGYLANYGLDPEKYLSPPSVSSSTDLSNISDADLLKALGE